MVGEAAVDGTGLELVTVGRIAEDDDQIAFAFRGVEPADVGGRNHER